MKRLISFITLFVTYAVVWAATTFTIDAPSQVAVGERFYVTFRLANGEGSFNKKPQINGCRLLAGPSTSTRQSYSMINGRSESSSSIDFTFVYLAEKEGSYTIPEQSIVADGKTYTTSAKKITIVKGDPNANHGYQQPRRGGYDPDYDDFRSQQSASTPVSANDVFVRIILSKSSAYEQEAIECTIKLYTKYQISSFFATKQPSFDGFLIEELDVQPALNQREQYNGQAYMTAILKKCIIFPQKSGKLTINSGNYDLKVVQFENINMGYFSVRSPQERELKVSSNSASIDIKPLPLPQPEGFNGAVGTFSINSKLVGSSFRTNDPATLIYTITGTGNIKYLKEPIIDFPSEFEQYSPQSNITSKVVGSNVSGTMTVEYTFVPQAVGDFKIGSDKFVYFDPASKEYRTLSTPTYDIKVAKGISSPQSVDKQDVASKNTDILHIKLGDKHLKQSHNPMVFNPLYWIAYLVILTLFVVALIVYRKQIKRRSDIQGLRLAKANKVARKRLKVAKKYMDSHQNDLFYEELLRALWGYLSDKLSIPVSQLSRENIQSELERFGASPDLTSDVIALLDECEIARYTPTNAESQVETIYSDAMQRINQLENVKRK